MSDNTTDESKHHTSAQLVHYIGRLGELSYTTDTNELWLHDAVTPGGTKLMDASSTQNIRYLSRYLTKQQIADAATGAPTIDLTATIQAAFDGLPANAFLKDDSESTYLVDGLSLSNKINVRVDMPNVTLRCPNGGTGGFTVSNCIRSNVRLGRIFKGTGSAPPDYNALTGSAFKVLQSSNCDFEFNRAEGYQYAWHLEDQTGNGVYFNRYRWSSVQYCKNAIYGTVSAGVVGYLNANRFYGGSLRSGAESILFVKGSAQTDPFNGNEFHCDIENATDCIVIDYAANNYFSHRFESGIGGISGLWVKSSATCTGNTYRSNFMPVDKLDLQGKAETFIGPIMSSANGIVVGSGAQTSLEGGVLHIQAFRDSASIPTATAGGQNVKSYVWNADVGNVSAQDKGVTALRILDNAGNKKLRYPSDAYILADNVNTDLPYNIGRVRVRSNTASVDIRLKGSDLRDGKEFRIEVAAFTNAIRVRNETDTLDLIAAGVINQVGTWLFSVSNGGTPQVILISPVAASYVQSNNSDVTTGRNAVVIVDFNQPITNNRTVTLNVTNPVSGDIVHVARSAEATGAFNINVGTGPLKVLSAASQFAKVAYNGATWRLIESGAI